MKSIEIDELKHLQCEVLQVAHDFCHEHGLKYSLACGTLLGAIRHNGYIPWDDDIDIYMPRADYDRFVKIFPDVYRQHYKLISLERSNQWCRAYANLYDDRTVWEEKKSSSEKQIGVNIDIFPVDNVPDDEEKWRSYDKRRRLLIYLSAAKNTSFRRENRSIAKNLIIGMLKTALFPFRAHQIAGWVDCYARKYDNIQTKRIFENSCGIIQKHPFLRDDFSTIISHRFEEKEFNIMAGYDDYLRNAFGDYMKLPPEKDRHPHHYFYAYWK